MCAVCSVTQLCQTLATPWTVVLQDPTRDFSGKNIEWAAISSSGNLPHLKIKPMYPVSPAFTGIFFTTESPGKPMWTIACQIPLSMGFSRQKSWSRLTFPSPGDLLPSGTEPESLTSPALAGLV